MWFGWTLGGVVVLIVAGSVAIWVHDKKAFERRHDGYIRGRGERPTTIEVLQHRAQRLDEFPHDCSEILLLAHKAGRRPLKRWSYWRRARRDMLRLCVSGISTAKKLMKNKSQAIGSALQELEIGMSETKVLCQRCLEVNKQEVASGGQPSSGGQPYCLLLNAKQDEEGEGSANGQPAAAGTIDIGPDGELRIHGRNETGQSHAT